MQLLKDNTSILYTVLLLVCYLLVCWLIISYPLNSLNRDELLNFVGGLQWLSKPDYNVHGLAEPLTAVLTALIPYYFDHVILDTDISYIAIYLDSVWLLDYAKSLLTEYDNNAIIMHIRIPTLLCLFILSVGVFVFVASKTTVYYGAITGFLVLLDINLLSRAALANGDIFYATLLLVNIYLLSVWIYSYPNLKIATLFGGMFGLLLATAVTSAILILLLAGAFILYKDAMSKKFSKGYNSLVAFDVLFAVGIALFIVLAFYKFSLLSLVIAFANNFYNNVESSDLSIYKALTHISIFAYLIYGYTLYYIAYNKTFIKTIDVMHPLIAIIVIIFAMPYMNSYARNIVALCPLIAIVVTSVLAKFKYGYILLVTMLIGQIFSLKMLLFV